MKQATLRFAPNLDSFLPRWRRGKVINYSFDDNATIKHLIEALGVPHTEVSKIRANDINVPFDHIVQDGDLVDVAADFFGNNIQTEIQGEHRFILDNHLGKLAMYLRILGFDTLYSNNFQDQELALTAQKEDRILLTRDRRLLMRSIVQYGYCLRNLDPHLQLKEVMVRYHLQSEIKPFQRCLLCNNPLIHIEKALILDRLEPLTCRYYEEFRICTACNKLFWKGSHYEHMLLLISEVEVGSF